MDTVDKLTRSRIMASVGQKDTKPEKALRLALHASGLRYRLNDKRLPGSPDLVFPKFNAVVFVHGCFWHAHGCKYSTAPSSNKEFWKDKFIENRIRDRKKESSLLALGLRVLIVWDCAITKAGADSLKKTVEKTIRWLKSQKGYNEIGARTIMKREHDNK